MAATALLMMMLAAGVTYRYNQKQQYYNHLRQLAPPVPPPYNAEALRSTKLAANNPFQLAMKAYQKGRYEEADTLLDQALKEDPQHALASYYQGGCRLMLARYKEAIRSFEACLEQAGDARYLQEDCRWYLALTFLNNKEPGKAKQMLSLLARNSSNAKKYEAEALLIKIDQTH